MDDEIEELDEDDEGEEVNGGSARVRDAKAAAAAAAAGGGDEGDEGDEAEFAEETEETLGFNPEILRAYEKSKLRYYFAVATCDTAETAAKLYDECDGVEFEHSAITFDLRFVPDDVDFADREVRDACTSVPEGYKPIQFENKALRHTRVALSWDEPEFERNFAFTRDVGEAFLDVFPRIVRRRMGQEWSEAEKQQQLEWRGRYAEFNLVYDRGTLFGLRTGGNIDAILMSLPPEARWS